VNTESGTNKFNIVIPARYGSSRFPGKPLAMIDGVPMVIRVQQRCLSCGAENVIVATDDERIYDVCQQYNATAVMTRSDHINGTDRLAEVVTQTGWSEGDIVVNVQGDEPLIPIAIVRQVSDNLAATPEASIATLATPIESAEEFADPTVVKVVFNQLGLALYFSRSPIPHNRDGKAVATPGYRHIGLYAYRVGFLRRYSDMQPCTIEDLEMLEQLRALYNGECIHVGVAMEQPGMGVDTPEQLAMVEKLIRQGNAS
jgi:3-deoxy-manno-octulosonate cytidylyltransferase (CMP-KDO synthetase)